MANDAKPLEQLNAGSNQVVEQIKHQLLGTVDAYFIFLQKTISSFPSGGTDAGEKLKSYAEKNVAATHQFVHKLSHAEDFTEVVRTPNRILAGANECICRADEGSRRSVLEGIRGCCQAALLLTGIGMFRT